MDHNPDGWAGSGTWVGIVATADYGASVGVDPRFGLFGLAARFAPVVTNDVLFAHGSHLGRHFAELSADTA
jgi:hypothetical protein